MMPKTSEAGLLQLVWGTEYGEGWYMNTRQGISTFPALSLVGVLQPPRRLYDSSL